MPPVRPRFAPLEERFEILGDATVLADRPALRSAVYPVLDRATGDERALRLWRKTGTPLDDDLRALWLHEQRQVQRLMASAGAPEVIVDVLEFVEDDEEFGVVLEDAGEQLSRFLQRASPRSWVRNLGAGRPRALLWRNLRRIAHAIGLLHSNGLVHGNVCAEVVMTRGAEEPDFQLGGFEWSLWFTAPTGARSHPHLAPVAPRPTAYSFAADWRALGALAADLLGATSSGNPGRAATNAPELSPPESGLLRRLSSPQQSELVDAASVLRSIDDIIAELGRTGSARTGAFILLVREATGLGRAVSRATDGAIAEDEVLEQLAWAATDLSSGATLFVPENAGSQPERLTLVTELISYSLRAFREAGGEAAWDIAYCESAVLREDDDPRGGRGTAHPIMQEVRFVRTHTEAKDLRARLGPSALDWSSFALTEEVDPEARVRAEIRRALNLLQVVEAFIRSLDALPVNIAEFNTQRGRRVVALSAADGERDTIAKEVGLGTTAATLRRLFQEENREGDSSWQLGPSAAFGDRRADVAATFIDFARVRGVPVYRFEIDEDLPPSPRLFLRPRQDLGTERVIRRRLRNIASLADQPGLADMFGDPFLVRRSTRETVTEDQEFQELDHPKQSALKGITSTLPLYLVVGPPGVGKTRLAREVVRRRFVAEPGARILLTAQGHDALDNLQDEVGKAIAAVGLNDTLLVRTPSEGRAQTDADVANKAAAMLAALASSSLATSAPPAFREKLAAIARSAGPVASDGAQRKAVWAATELLLDAANVVVSTTNSSFIERLVQERSRFDAVIVEEAAKATGPELVGVLSLAGRRLLIGDHHQLPPFDALRLQLILGNHSLLTKVLELADDQVGFLFAGGELAELRRACEDQAAFLRLAGVALRLIEPFRAYVEDDQRRAKANPTGRRIAATLTEQRRMHPAMAKIVSNAFYGGDLKTADEKRKQADEEPSPVEFAAPLTASPVIVIDFEHVSRTGSAGAHEERPAWHSPREVDAVVDVLRLCRPSPLFRGRPTLAVLSPYRKQVEQLDNRLRSLSASGEASWLESFAPARPGLGYVGTTDSFQGSEADLVIVSLVRNNPRAGRSALGFLSDPRRMNVLLSRAKSRLVLVGSLLFLKEAVRGVNPDSEQHELTFLTSVLETIDSLRGQTASDGTPLATIMRPEKLRARQ